MDIYKAQDGKNKRRLNSGSAFAQRRKRWENVDPLLKYWIVQAGQGVYTRADVGDFSGFGHGLRWLSLLGELGRQCVLYACIMHGDVNNSQGTDTKHKPS